MCNAAIGIDNDKLYVIGGTRINISSTNNIFVLDLLKANGVTLPEIYGHSGTFIKGKFYLPVRHLFIYDVEKIPGVWKKRASVLEEMFISLT